MESSRKTQPACAAWSPVAKRSRNLLIGGRRRSRKRANWAIAAAGCVWLRPWSPVSFSIADTVETTHRALRRHAPRELVHRGKGRDAICGDRKPGRCLGAGFIALSVFGLFEGHDDGHDDAKDSRRSKSSSKGRKNDDALKRLLMGEEGHEEGESFRRNISEWWESLPVVGQSESRRKRRKQKEEGEADSIRRSFSEWWDNLPVLGHSEAKRKQKAERDEERSDEDAESGIFSVLASVKTSVVAAVLGTGRAEEKVEAEEPKEPLSQFLPEFPTPTGLFTQDENADSDAGEATEAVEKEEEPDDWWQNAQAALGMTPSDEAEETKSKEEPLPVQVTEPEKEEVTSVATPEVPDEKEEEVEEEIEEEVEEEVQVEESSEVKPPDEEEEERPLPEAPGMEDANLIVRVDIEPKKQRCSLGAKAVENLMSRSDREVLEAMAQEGWEVEVVNESEGLYMLSLPPVLYEVMGTSVSIPAPRFLTKLRDSRGRTSKFKERLEGDLVLQNGENIFTLQLGFPFRTKLSISAAGWTRAKVGFDGDEILSSNFVEVGIQLPKVPGLTNIMEYFVKNYGTQSTQECTDALARAAERLPETPLQSIEDTMKEFLKPLTDPEGKEKKLVESGPGSPST